MVTTPTDPRPVSRVVHQIDRSAAHPASAAVVAALIVAFGLALAYAGFPSNWETAFAAACAAVTTVMVFVIQHTQKREQAATQLKLDEIIRALPGADDHLVKVESAGDAELERLSQDQLAHHRSVRAGD